DADVPVRVALGGQGEELVVVEADRGSQAVAAPVRLAGDGARGLRAPAAGVLAGGSVDVRIVEDRLIEIRSHRKAAELDAGFLVSRADAGQDGDAEILI